jgi:hypothetical protein
MFIHRHYNCDDLKKFRDKLLERMVILSKLMEHTDRENIEFELLYTIISHLNRLIDLEYN